MNYHRLTSMACPPELIGFGNGSMVASETAEQTMRVALQQIVRDYENVDLSHKDFRVRAAQVASAAIAASSDFPKPQRRDGKEPCGECRLSVGETCDICGAVQKESTYAGIPLPEHARSGVYGWHPGDEA